MSTPDEGDIGRGTHQATAVEAGDPSDVVPNLVVPDEPSGKHIHVIPLPKHPTLPEVTHTELASLPLQSILFFLNGV